jgi:hypothetical protein
MPQRAYVLVLAFFAVTFSACVTILGDFSKGNPADASTPEASTDGRPPLMDVVTTTDVASADGPEDSATGCVGPSTQTCTSCGTETRTCDGGTWSAWSTCMNEVNTSTDINNCGTCAHMCQQPTSPSHGLCINGVCTQYVGGYITMSGTTPLDPMGSTIYAVQAPLETGGTFQGITGVIDSTAQSDQVEFALWADNGMETAPGNLIWWAQTTIPQTNVPTAITATASQSGAMLADAAAGAPIALSPGMYWVSIHPQYETDNVAPVSANSGSPCVQESWINIQPPASWSNAGEPTTCPALQQYMTVTF